MSRPSWTNVERKIEAALDSGRLAVSELSYIRVEHERSCPGNDPRVAECNCDPSIMVPMSLTVNRVVVAEMERARRKYMNGGRS